MAGIEALLERMDRLIAMGERAERQGHMGDGWPYGRPGGYGSASRFLQPTDENTLMWGQTTDLSFTSAAIGDGINKQSEQLVHVSRTRPTSYNVLTIVDFGNGWSGEAAFAVQVRYFLGLGSAKATFTETVAIPVPADNSKPVQLSRLGLPAHAIQVQVVLAGVAALVGPHSCQATVMAAPVYA